MKKHCSMRKAFAAVVAAAFLMYTSVVTAQVNPWPGIYLPEFKMLDFHQEEGALSATVLFCQSDPERTVLSTLDFSKERTDIAYEAEGEKLDMSLTGKRFTIRYQGLVAELDRSRPEPTVHDASWERLFEAFMAGELSKRLMLLGHPVSPTDVAALGEAGGAQDVSGSVALPDLVDAGNRSLDALSAFPDAAPGGRLSPDKVPWACWLAIAALLVAIPTLFIACAGTAGLACILAVVSYKLGIFSGIASCFPGS